MKNTHLTLVTLSALLAATIASNVMGLTMQDIATKPAAHVEAALPNEHPAQYYAYAKRLFESGQKDDAVFWFYVGQLRYRFYLKANPNLKPDGDPALLGSLNETLGKTFNLYAGGSPTDWVKQMERALAWDEKTPNGFTSKEKFASELKQIRDGLGGLRDNIRDTAESIREQRKAQGLENR